MLNLTFKGSIEGISLVPEKIDISLGEVSSKFRLSVPKDVNDGSYYIVWETYNDEEVPLYSPLKKTKVIITKNQSTN